MGAPTQPPLKFGLFFFDYDLDGRPDEVTRPLLEPVLQPLWAAYAALKRARDAREPLFLDLPERKILLNPDGTVDRVTVPERRPSIEDVGRRAGVSRQTVSRVLNGHPMVSADARRRVEAAIEELRYRPSWAARAMVTGRASVIGIVTTRLMPARAERPPVGRPPPWRTGGRNWPSSAPPGSCQSPISSSGGAHRGRALSRAGR